MALEKSKLLIQIEVDSKGSVTKIGKVDSAIKKVGKTSSKAAKEISSFGKSMETMASKIIVANQAFELMAKVVRAVGVAYGATAGQFAKFETSLKKVQKTTNISSEEARKLGLTFRRMSTEIPVAASELADIAAIAGQLGVRGSANLEKFATTIARVTASTDLNAEAASLAFARILSLTKTAVSDIDRFASAVVNLGNKFKTGEAAIVSMANEIARSTELYSISAAEVLGLSTALKTMGVRAEIGGTAIGKTFAALNKLTQEGGPLLDQLTQSMGMTGNQFRKVFEEDAATAFTMFIETLGKFPKLQIGQVLEEMGLRGQGVAKIIAPLTGQIDTLRDAMFEAKIATAENTAAANEAAIAWDTLSGDTVVMKNNLVALGITVGEIVAPAIRALFQVIAKIAGAFNSFAMVIGEVDFKGLVKEIDSLTFAIIGGAGLVAAIITLQAEFTALALFGTSGALSGMIVKVIALSKALLLASGSALALSIKLAGVVAIGLGIFAVVATIELLARNFDKFGQVVDLVWALIVRGAAKIELSIKQIAKATLEWADDLLPFLNVATEDFKKLDDAINESRIRISELDREVDRAKKGLDLGFSGKLIEEWNKLMSRGKEKVEELGEAQDENNKKQESSLALLRRRVALLGEIGDRLRALGTSFDLSKIGTSGSAAVQIFGNAFDKAFQNAAIASEEFNKIARLQNKKTGDAAKEGLKEVVAAQKRADSALIAVGVEKFNMDVRNRQNLQKGLKDQFQAQGQLARIARIVGKERIDSLQKELEGMARAFTALKDNSKAAMESLAIGKRTLGVVIAQVNENIRLAEIMDMSNAHKANNSRLETTVELQKRLFEISEREEKSIDEQILLLNQKATVSRNNLDILALELAANGQLSEEMERQIQALKEQEKLKLVKDVQQAKDDLPVDAELIGQRGALAIEFLGSDEVARTFEAAGKRLEVAGMVVRQDINSMTEELSKAMNKTGESLSTLGGDFLESMKEGAGFMEAIQAGEGILAPLVEATEFFIEGTASAAMRTVSAVVNAVEGAWDAGSKVFRKLFKSNGPLNQFFFTIGKGMTDMAAGFFGQFPAIMGAFKKISKTVGDIGKGIKAFATLDLKGIGVAMGKMAESLMDAGIAIFSPSFWEGANGIVETFLNLPENLDKIFRELIENLDKFVAGFVDAIVGLLQKMPIFIQAIADMIPLVAQALVDGLILVIQSLPNIMARLIDGIIAGILVLINALPEILSQLFDAIPLVINKIIMSLPDILVRLLEQLPSIVEELVQGLVASSAEIAIAFTEATILQSPKIIIALVKAVPKLIAAVARGMVTAIKKAWTAFIEGSRIPAPRLIDDNEMGELMKGQLKDAKKAAKGFGEDLFKIVDIDKRKRTNPLGSAGGGDDDSGGDGGDGGAIDDGQGRTGGIFAWLKDTWLKLWGWVVDFWEWIKENWRKLWGWVEDFGIWIMEQFRKILAVFGAIGTAISDFLKTIRDAFIELLTAFGTLIMNIGIWFREIPGKIKASWDKMIKFFEDLPEKFLTKWNEMVAAFKALPANFKKKWDETITALTSGFTEIGAKITTALNGLAEKLGIKDIGADVKKMFTDITDSFTGMGDKLVTPIKEAFSGIAGKLKTAISAPFDGIIDKLISAIKSTIKGLLPKFALGGAIPAFATGGAITTGITAYAEGGSIIQGAKADIPGPDDTIIGAQEGEFMIRKASAASIGTGALNFMNQTGAVPQSGGSSNTKVSTNISEGAIVVQGAGMDPMEIADVIFAELKRRSMDGEFMVAQGGIRETA